MMVKKLSKFLVRDRYELSPGLQDLVTLSLDNHAGVLHISRQGDAPVTYSMIDEKGGEVSWAIQIDGKSQSEELQIGTVIFEREALMMEHFPDSDCELTFRITDGGHIGILDISDIGETIHDEYLGILVAKDRARHRKIVYFFDTMPIIISRARGTWVIKTLLHEEGDATGPWYFIS